VVYPPKYLFWGKGVFPLRRRAESKMMNANVFPDDGLGALEFTVDERGMALVALVCRDQLVKVGKMVPHITICTVKIDYPYYAANKKHTPEVLTRLAELTTELKFITDKTYEVYLNPVAMHSCTGLHVDCDELIGDLFVLRRLHDKAEWERRGVKWCGAINDTHMTISPSDQWPLANPPSLWLWVHCQFGRRIRKRMFRMSVGVPRAGYTPRGEQGAERTATRVPQVALGAEVMSHEFAALRTLKPTMVPGFYMNQLLRIGKIAQRQSAVNCCAVPYVCMECDGGVEWISYGKGSLPPKKVRTEVEPLSLPDRCGECVAGAALPGTAAILRPIAPTNTTTTTTTTTTITMPPLEAKTD
jgi:hypothetical protein